MKKYRRYIPSLDALVFFEAAARQGNFTKAALELYVTQAAVSKRIRELESRLNIKLFLRNGRILTLTQAGRRLYEQSSMALEYLEDACRQASGEVSEVIRIAANSAISLLWLAPKLKTFGLSENSVNINVFTSDKPGDTITPENDLIVIYGYGDTPGWEAELLFSECLVPVASPGYLDTLGMNTELSNLEALINLDKITLLEYERFAPDWINWQLWIEKSSNLNLIKCQKKMCRNYIHAIGMAIEGQGIALGSLGLIDDELKSERLVVIGKDELASGRAYYLAHSRKNKLSPACELFRHELLSY